MEATHDLDFVLWCLEPAKPIRVYSQINFGTMRETSGASIPDTQWITVTMDSGVSFVIGAGWTLPPGYPNFSTTWIEFVGTEGAVMVDDSHRDVVLNTMDKGMVLPMSTMPGEAVDHTYAGPMAAETIHFLEAVALDQPVLVTPEHARMVMEVYIAADLSAETQRAGVVAACRRRRRYARSHEAATHGEEEPQAHRSRHHRRRPGRVVPRRSRSAPSPGRLHRTRGDQAGPGPSSSPTRSAPIS